MARSVWISPTDSTKKVFADSRVAPATSPAPAGNSVVPSGYIRQIGNDGLMDTGAIFDQYGNPQPATYQAGKPYFTGGWPPDPQAGQPFHTQQRGQG